MGKVLHPKSFPWCIYKSKESVIETIFFGDPSAYNSNINIFESLNSNLELSMALYWRVKSWRFHGSFSANAGAGVTIVNFDKIFTRQVSSEEELVCTTLSNFDGENYQAAKPLTGDQNIPFSVPGIIGTFNAKARLSIPSTIVSPLPTSVALANHYYGNSVFNWIDYRLVPAGSGDFSQGFTNQTAGAEATSYPISFLNQTFQLPTFATPDVENVTINIEAIEYWSYGGLYDTTTGLPL